MSKKKIAIIGAGASGMFAASLLNDLNADIYLFEKNDKIGKKILASGNGKCNFTNCGNLVDKYNNVFANNIIEKFNVECTLDYFSNIGLIYKFDDQGRGYPLSECATSVLDCLKSSINNVSILLNNNVKRVYKSNGCYFLESNDKKYEFDYIVCCSGSCASNLGSDKAYTYLNGLNLSISDFSPSLTPVIVKENVKDLMGVRVKCLVHLVDEKYNKIYSEYGEVIFKSDGLSGIAIFNVSSYINRNRNKKYKIILDLSNGMSKSDLGSYFNRKNIKNLFKGYLNDKIANYIIKLCNIDKIDEQKIKSIVKNIKALEFNVAGLYPLKESQVCSGGVSLHEVDDNLRLKSKDRVYIAGELLDIDGVCGGYNLQFCWSCAGVISSDIKRRISNEVF